jgi:hypothetical protein
VLLRKIAQDIGMPMNPDEALEATASDTFWIPDDVTVVEEEGLVTLCCPRPKTHYNMVVRLRPAGREQAVVSRIVELHDGRESIVPVTSLNASPALEQALRAHGYACRENHDAYTCDVARYAVRRHPGIEARMVMTLAELRGFMSIMDLAFDKRVERSEAELERFLEDGRGARIRRFVAFEGDVPVSAGGITAHPKLGLGFLWGGGTVPDRRGRGGYSAVMAARVAWARSIGLTRVGLYARRHTSAPIVEKQGFSRHGFMDYWRRPGSAEPTAAT